MGRSCSDGRRKDPIGGFLLTETLATFTISAFVLLGLVSATTVLLRAMDGSVARIERVDDLGRAMEAIRQDIAGLSRARWNGTEPQAFVFRGGPNSLYFARRAPAVDGGRTPVAVALREIVVEGRPMLARSTARLGARAISFGDLAFGPQHEVWTGATRLRFSYVPSREGKGEPMARTSWPIGAKLPAAILVEAIDRETRRVLVATRLTIEANADLGCIVDSAAPASDPAVAQGDPAQPQPAQAGAVPPPAGGAVSPVPPAAGAAPGAGAAQAAASDAFCSRAELDDDKGAKPPSATAATAGTAPL